MKTRRFTKAPAMRAVTLAALGSIGLAACGSSGYKATSPASTSAPAAPATPGASAPAPSGTMAVTITNFAFAPPNLTIKVGTTVTWTNKDEEPHTVVGGGMNSPVLGNAGSTYSPGLAITGEVLT
ncbi:MAG: amidase [Actinomycetota bacterium]|nr:amidase [Actinomycetota bacterium]